ELNLISCVSCVCFESTKLGKSIPAFDHGLCDFGSPSSPLILLESYGFLLFLVHRDSEMEESVYPLVYEVGEHMVWAMLVPGVGWDLQSQSMWGLKFHNLAENPFESYTCTCISGPFVLQVKENSKNDKIRSKPYKNEKRGEAGKSQKQLQWIEKEKLKKTQKEGPKMQTHSSLKEERKEES
nr:hypothetical protein [Tanacetum cinerariifolium]